MRILVFGDSITQGFHDTEFGGWCNRLSSFVMKKEIESDYDYNKSVVNLGISGDTTADLVTRIKNESEARLLKYKTDTFDVLVLAIGVNDSQFTMSDKELKIPIAASRRNLDYVIDQMKSLFGKVVLVGIAPVFDERIQPMAWKPTHGYSNQIIESYNQMLKDFAIEHGCLFIDMDKVYGGNEKECLPDGIHPNAEGHRLIFEHVKESLEKEGIL